MGPSIKKTLDWHGCDSVCHPMPSATSIVEIDDVAYSTVPQIAGLLQAVSEERDELCNPS